MFLPETFKTWRISAENRARAHYVLPIGESSGIVGPAAGPSNNTPAENCQNRYPSPSRRPDPNQVRPLTFMRPLAFLRHGRPARLPGSVHARRQAAVRGGVRMPVHARETAQIAAGRTKSFAIGPRIGKSGRGGRDATPDTEGRRACRKNSGSVQSWRFLRSRLAGIPRWNRFCMGPAQGRLPRPRSAAMRLPALSSAQASTFIARTRTSSADRGLNRAGPARNENRAATGDRSRWPCLFARHVLARHPTKEGRCSNGS